MDSNNFSGWPGFEEIIENFGRIHPTQEAGYPARTWGNEAWAKEFTDAITVTHSVPMNTYGEPAEWRSDKARLLFPLLPATMTEAIRQNELLVASHGNAVPFRLKYRLQHPDTSISTHTVTKFKHSNLLAVLGMPRYTANGLYTCRQIQDFPLALHFSSHRVSG